jgi:hypothetical protein
MHFFMLISEESLPGRVISLKILHKDFDICIIRIIGTADIVKSRDTIVAVHGMQESLLPAGALWASAIRRSI